MLKIYTSLHVERKIENQSEVHKLLTKLLSKGKAPERNVKLIVITIPTIHQQSVKKFFLNKKNYI